MGLAWFSAFDISGPELPNNCSIRKSCGGSNQPPVSGSAIPYFWIASHKDLAIFCPPSEVRKDATPSAVAAPASAGLPVYPATSNAISEVAPSQSLSVASPALCLAIRSASEAAAPSFPLITWMNCLFVVKNLPLSLNNSINPGMDKANCIRFANSSQSLVKSTLFNPTSSDSESII